MGRVDIDHRTDIWSLGVIAFECLMGIRLFQRDSLTAMFVAICQEPAPVPSNVAWVPPRFISGLRAQ